MKYSPMFEKIRAEKLSRRTLLQGLSAAAVLAAGGCNRRSSQNLVHIATSAGLNLTMSELMHQQRFMESFGLEADMVALADGTKILGGIYSGSLDVSPMSGFGQLFPAMEHGAEMRLINAATLVPLTALFSGKPDVHTLKDLEGKVVGIGALGSLVHQLTVALLRKYSVDVSAVRFVNIGSNTDIFKGVMAGTVDAGSGPASYIEDAESYKVHVLQNGNMSEELKEFTYQAGYTSRRLIETKRDALVRVLAAYAKLFRFVQGPSSLEAFVKARKTVLPSSADREHVAEWNWLQKVKPFAPGLTLSAERINYMQQINIDFNVQRRILPFERVADMSLAQDALKLLG
jgi:ABC-type nitrate/sulfonate/bicarbonate transport system substrate-binding protein